MVFINLDTHYFIGILTTLKNISIILLWVISLRVRLDMINSSKANAFILKEIHNGE